MKKAEPANGRKKRKTRIVIVDDHPMMREGLAQLINNEPDLMIVGQAGDARSAVEAVQAFKPDLAITDLSLPDKHGLELIKDLRVLHPELRILVNSMHDEALHAERVLRAGARGYIMKQEGGKRVIAAIRQVINGQIYVSEKISAKILESLSGGPGASTSPLDKLTDREFQVFQLIGQGRDTKYIASHLHLSPKTVEVHRANIKTKLDLKSGAELVHHAIRWTEAQPGGGS